MKLIYLLSLITITSNIYSGVKIAIDTNTENTSEITTKIILMI